VRVRAHFLLNTGNGTPSLKWGSTNAYTEDAAGNPIYSWTLMDGIMDSITGAGTLPLVEIAFMPQALSTRLNPYMDSGVGALDGGCFYPPRTTQVGGLYPPGQPTKARYPGSERSWQWGFWNGPHRLLARYARRLRKLYDYGGGAAPVARTLPWAAGGGGARRRFHAVLQHCATGSTRSGQAGTRLDLISFPPRGRGDRRRSRRDEPRQPAGLHRPLQRHRRCRAFKQTPIVAAKRIPTVALPVRSA
jgi:xylan 1,4-beta-xylosidase